MGDIDAIRRKSSQRFRLSPDDPSPAGPVSQFQPGDVWPLTKQIDGLGGEWTFPTFMWRAMNFHLVNVPPSYYEPVSSFERLRLEALLIQRAASMVPDPELGMLSVVVKVFPSIFSVLDGVLVLPEEGESCIGQHFLTVLGVQDESTVVFANTWSGWKSDHIGYLSREYFDRYAQEGWILRLWNRGPLAATAETLLSSNNSGEFRRLWHSTRRQGTIRNIGGDNSLRLRWYECWSLQAETPAELLVLELEGRIRVAVAVLVHHTTMSDLSELFVWPNYRRRGYGKLLEEAAADRSRQAGSQELGFYVWNADVVQRNNQAVSFLVNRGFTIQQFEDCQAAMYGKRKIC